MIDVSVMLATRHVANMNASEPPRVPAVDDIASSDCQSLYWQQMGAILTPRPTTAPAPAPETSQRVARYTTSKTKQSKAKHVN